MPFSEVDRTTALIVIDLQRGIAGRELAHPVPAVLARIRELLDAFRRLGLPVVLVNVDGVPPGRTDVSTSSTREFPPGWADLIPELGAQPDDLLITKHTRSAFTRTGLLEALHERGATQVVVTGIATSGGVESTARDAHEQGLHVSLPVDAMTDSTLARHDYSIANILPRIAETGTTADLLTLLTATHA